MEGVNRYGYCSNNPVNYVDPSGEVAWVEVLRNSYLSTLATDGAILEPSDVAPHKWVGYAVVGVIVFAASVIVGDPASSTTDEAELSSNADIGSLSIVDALITADSMLASSIIEENIQYEREMEEDLTESYPDCDPFSKKMLRNSISIAEDIDINELEHLIKHYGGEDGIWKKKKGWDDCGNEWHWYENKKVGRVRAKIKWLGQ